MRLGYLLIASTIIHMDSKTILWLTPNFTTSCGEPPAKFVIAQANLTDFVIVPFWKKHYQYNNHLFYYYWMNHSMGLFEWLIQHSACLLQIIWTQSLEDVIKGVLLADSCSTSSSWAHLPLIPWVRCIGRYTVCLWCLHSCMFQWCCKYSTYKSINKFTIYHKLSLQWWIFACLLGWCVLMESIIICVTLICKRFNFEHVKWTLWRG